MKCSAIKRQPVVEVFYSATGPQLHTNHDKVQRETGRTLTIVQRYVYNIDVVALKVEPVCDSEGIQQHEQEKIKFINLKTTQ